MKKLKSLNEMLEEMKGILKGIKSGDSVCLIHHNDADGCCSAAMFSMLVRDLTGESPLLFPVSGGRLDKRFVSELSSLNPSHVFSLDISIDPRDLDVFRGFILDHHVFDVPERRGDMRYFNQHSFEKDHDKVFPTSYVVHELLTSFFPDKKAFWIAGIGITEDQRVEICKEIFEKIKKEWPSLLKVEKIDQKSLEKSFFGELWDMVRSGRMVRGLEGAKTAVLALMECEDRPDKFVNGLTRHSSALRKFYERVVHETQNNMRNVEEKGEFSREKRVIFYEFEGTRLSGYTSFISDKMRQKYPDWVSCAINKNRTENKAKVSVRVDGEVRDDDLVSVVKDLTKKIPSLRGGGHKSAVGMEMGLDDLNEFKREFLARF